MAKIIKDLPEVRMVLEDPDLLIIHIKSEVSLTEISINKIFRFIEKDCKLPHVRVLVFSPKNYQISGRARARAKRLSSVATAVAAVTSSVVGRVITNLFINIQRPKFPIRIFKDEETARIWLEKYRIPEHREPLRAIPGKP